MKATWISRQVTPKILEAIQATDRSTHVFYITGPGGTGKTITLRQVGQALGSPDGIAPAFPYSGILDLYHSEINTNSGLEEHLSIALEREDEFKEYRDEREAFSARREAGEYGVDLEEERTRLADLFAGGINVVTDDHRVIIALDTTERIRYDTDEVQRFCRLEEENTAVKVWLLEQLRRWQNCVVILAGREDRDLQEALAALAKERPIRYHLEEWTGFTEAEALEYFARQEQEYPEVKLFDPQVRRRLYEVTEGRPIRLDLAIHVARFQIGLDRFLARLNELPPGEARDWIDRLLIQQVMEEEPDSSIRTILRCLAVARKGLDAPRLSYLVRDWDIDECRRRLEAIANRSFIKILPEDGRFFLHDEMYDLCDKYLLEPEEVQQLSAQLVAWYDQQIEESGENIEKKQDYQVDSLLYRLRVEPQEGYHWYAMRADESIRYAEIGFEMQLRHELLAFLKSPSRIDDKLRSLASALSQEVDYDCAGRWVKRLLSRGRYQEAVRVAELVIQAADKFYPANAPGSELAWADLNVYYAQALMYVNRVEEGIALTKAVIDELEEEEKPEIVARHTDPLEYTGLRRNLALGRAHNNLGYVYRLPQQGHYQLALEELRQAVPYFRASDLWEEYANTLDNTGRVYTLLYERSRAESLIEDGLELRRQLGRGYRIALSLISRAVAHLTFDEPHRARRLCEEALSICEQLGVQRGIGLALIPLGQALRKLGALGTVNLYPPEAADNFFREAIGYLKRAATIFETKVSEPVRLIEAYNELGCTCRDRAILARSIDPRSPLARSILRDAVQYLTKSIELAEKQQSLIMYVDACEDLAQAYFQREDYHYVDLWLERAAAHIPDRYKVQEGVGLDDIPAAECVEEFWQLLGKIELLQGYRVYDTAIATGGGKISPEVLAQAVHHFAFAAAYFERYSEKAPGLEKTFKQLYNRFKLCRYEDLRYIQDELLPEIAEKYKLDRAQLGKFFEDTMGLAMQL